MKNSVLLLSMLLGAFCCFGQSVNVEFDKGVDLSKYKTFKFGEGEIITPKDLRLVPDSTLHRWVRTAVYEELVSKGLEQVTTAPDLIVSYVTGTQTRSDAGNLGPLGLTPGSNTSQTYLRDYRSGSLVIDLNDAKNNKLAWRVNATTNTNNPEAEKVVEQIVSKGFKKFSLKPKKVKKKK